MSTFKLPSKFTNNNTVNSFVIKTPNGIKANQTLNTVADQLDAMGKIKNIERGFDMGFDGVWEYVIKNTKTDKAVVIKQHPNTEKNQIAFLYALSFATQTSEDARYNLKNGEVFAFAQAVISEISK